MSRGEKIVASVLGILVFFGLFFFIYSSMKTTPAYPPVDEAAADYGDDYNFNVEGDTTTVDEALPEEPAPAETTKKDEKQPKK
ncbi:MAG TPA: hypothetical protein PK362_08685 [Elusimicrobiota bacterium]|nr:hypothetical protein [Elusimicrobiota bacterium]